MESVKKDILTIIRAYINKNYNFEIYNNVSDVLDITNKCGIGLILAYSLKKNELYRDISNLDNTLFFNVARCEKQEIVRNQIKALLEENGINFIFLKGMTLSKYYDEDYLRYSDDIDLIVERNNYEKAREILLNNGFSLFVDTLNESTLKTKDNVFLDLHYMFSHNDEETEKIFKNVKFDNSHELNDEYKYIFSIYHAAKHLKMNYISLQFLFDIYYLNKLNCDKQFINDRLKEIRLDKFNNATLQLLDFIINEKENELGNRYFDFLINTANTKGIENMVLVGQGNGKNRISYLISRAFPKYDEMCRMYPQVENNKLLLPYYYVRRIIDRTKQGHGSYAINEINASLKVNKTKVEETKKLFEEIGL